MRASLYLPLRLISLPARYPSNCLPSTSACFFPTSGSALPFPFLLLFPTSIVRHSLPPPTAACPCGHFRSQLRAIRPRIIRLTWTHPCGHGTPAEAPLESVPDRVAGVPPPRFTAAILRFPSTVVIVFLNLGNARKRPSAFPAAVRLFPSTISSSDRAPRCCVLRSSSLPPLQHCNCPLRVERTHK